MPVINDNKKFEIKQNTRGEIVAALKNISKEVESVSLCSRCRKFSNDPLKTCHIYKRVMKISEECSVSAAIYECPEFEDSGNEIVGKVRRMFNITKAE